MQKILAVLYALVAASILYGGTAFYRVVYTPMHQAIQEHPIVQIKPATSAAQLVSQLAARKLIDSPRLVLLLIRAQGLSTSLRAGVYQVQVGESVAQFLQRVARGDVLTLKFRVPEGMTKKSVDDMLQQAPYLSYHPEDWRLIESICSKADGLLLADTYQYNAGSRATALLTQAHERLEHYLNESWQNRAPGLPYKTACELLIVASILEKEAALPEERRLISGVVVNRLQKNMPLQMDPTVIYGLQSSYTGQLTKANLKIDSPYNTYRVRGLPPAPITMVGKDAIDAAAHPQLSNYLYFVARGDGRHQFSVTYEEQRAAVLQYRQKQDRIYTKPPTSS